MTDQELQVQHKQEVQQAGESTKPERQFVPAVDIYETDQTVTVLAEMPGVSREGVAIHLEDGVLTIQGDRDGEKEKGKPLLREYETGRYLRRFTIAETIDQEKIEATMANGILTLVLPKTEPAKPRKIAVRSG